MPDPSPSNPFAPGLFTDQVAVVTGGGTGIGLACARMMSQLGATVVLMGRREEVVKESARALEEKGGKAFGVACDIRDPEVVEEAVTTVLKEAGRIDVLINNAGGQFPAPAEAISPKGFDAVVRNNLSGTWIMTRQVAVSAMIPAKAGSIVNVIAQVERGFPGMMHTGAARAGVENMTRTLAIEWVGHNIRINAVAPGYIRSSGTDQYPPELREMARQRTPMKRLGTVEETANGIVMIASPAASFITGETLYIDGGARLWGETWPIEDRQ